LFIFQPERNYPADAVIVTTMVCSVVTLVLVGASNFNQRYRAPLTGTERPVWPPANFVAEQAVEVVLKAWSV
jgi:hypothetical protein